MTVINVVAQFEIYRPYMHPSQNGHFEEIYFFQSAIYNASPNQPQCIMSDAVHLIRRILCMFPALLLLMLPACQNGDDVESAERREPSQPRLLQGRAENGSADTTRLRLTYDEIGEHYLRMVTRYEDMIDQMSPEVRQHYEQMRRHYQDLMRDGMADQDEDDDGVTDEGMPGGGRMDGGMADEGTMDDGMMLGGMMEEGMMARRVMTIHDRDAWTRRMLGMHEEMAQLHKRSDEETMAEMHEQMAALYRITLADTSATRKP